MKRAKAVSVPAFRLRSLFKKRRTFPLPQSNVARAVSAQRQNS
jgi:hypothetical protein